MQQGTWRAIEGKVSGQQFNQHGILMGSMVVVMGKGVQVSPELELEERDRVKTQVLISSMAQVDMRVLALEELVGGDQYWATLKTSVIAMVPQKSMPLQSFDAGRIRFAIGIPR